jgi:hypothetical protein
MRRKEIYTVISGLNEIINVLQKETIDNVCDLINNFISDIQSILDDEEDYKENIPENLQNGYRYQESEMSCDNLESAIDELENISEDDSCECIVNTIDNAVNYLDSAM